MHRVIIITLLSHIVVACAPQAEAPAPEPPKTAVSASPEKEPAEPDCPVKLTDKSSAALKKLADGGKGPWVIFSQGLCNGKPAVGIYEAGANPPQDGESVTVKGVNFIIDYEIVDLMSKHGDLLVEGPVDKDNNFMVTFTNP